MLKKGKLVIDLLDKSKMRCESTTGESEVHYCEVRVEVWRNYVSIRRTWEVKE